MAQTKLNPQQVIIYKQVKKTPKGIPQSLLDAVASDPERFAKDLKNNPRIIDFGTFVIEGNKVLSFGKQSNAREYFRDDISKELWLIVFNTKTIRNTIINNVGQAKADEIYQQPQQIPTPKGFQPSLSVFTTTQQVKGYQTKKGQQKRSYVKSIPRRFKPVQKTFLKTRRQQRQKPQAVIKQYRQLFPSDKRSDSSLKTAYFRAR